MINILRNALIKTKLLEDPKKIDIHPLLKKTIKWQFEADGKHYYKFEHDYEIPIERFRFAKKFYIEVQNRVTHDELIQFCYHAKTLLDNGKLGDTYKMVDDLEYQLSWSFEPVSLLRFASVIFFDLNENIEEYDPNYNYRKIKSFEKKKVFQFLLRKLMDNSAILSTLSGEDLEAYLSQMSFLKERALFTKAVEKVS